jgi:predicted NAD-dependent protein-ADP-ribosyltransferase YbiA (DUF1768 family)
MARREYIAGEEIIKFYSGGLRPYHTLSNFAHVLEGIELDGLIFPSTEHAFQSQKIKESERWMFSVNGPLGQIEEGFKLVSGKDWEKKRDYWMKKGNIGVIAKMATGEKLLKKLGLKKVPDFQSTDELWIRILRQKFVVEEFRLTLMSTKDAYLLEFDRGAQRKPAPPFWGGMIVEGVLCGHNKMGEYLMIVRNL